ncbi:MAG TPA: mevalonate kinase [Candidatus Thalassarchaeaceae archaeon]|nr:mevalonate kinase [Candidatus Thalassarchaeaceae archaeon]
MASAFAPGKCILFGEHAVVFGHPAVAVAIDQGVRVSIRESPSWILEGASFDPSRHPHISHIIQSVFQYDGPPLNIDVESSLFSAAGMGSSAALSNAFGAALHSFLRPEDPLIPIDLARMAHSAEATAQKGRASPTDTATSALGGFVVVSGQRVEGTRHVFDTSLVTPEGKRDWSINTVDVPKGVSDAWLVIGFTGKGSPTGKMVAKVAKLVSGNPERMNDLETIANITKAGLTALSAGNLEGLGIAMDACHDCLKNLEVSSPRLDRLVEAARPHSLGTKLTGAGGGGCMVALTLDPERVSQAIEVAGGRPLTSKLGANGVRILGN